MFTRVRLGTVQGFQEKIKIFFLKYRGGDVKMHRMDTSIAQLLSGASGLL